MLPITIQMKIIRLIYGDGELIDEVTFWKFRIDQTEGSRQVRILETISLSNWLKLGMDKGEI